MKCQTCAIVEKHLKRWSDRHTRARAAYATRPTIERLADADYCARQVTEWACALDVHRQRHAR